MIGTNSLPEIIYLPKDIREQWAKHTKEELFAFLRDGLELIETYAEFKPEALDFLKRRPLLNKVVNGDE